MTTRPECVGGTSALFGSRSSLGASCWPSFPPPSRRLFVSGLGDARRKIGADAEGCGAVVGFERHWNRSG